MFSGTVKLLDLNDYIKPGEECVVLTKSSKLDPSTKAYLNIDGEDLRPDLIKPTTSEKAKISINDCLACNGCITSSEAVLVEEQSIARFLEQYNKFGRRFVLISPQSRASIAYYTGLSEKEVQLRLSEYFRGLGFEFVDDFTLHIDIVKELEYRRLIGSQIKPQMCSECPGWVCYLEKVLGDKFIPYASSVKTPQLFAAELYKNLLSIIYNTKYEDVYCVLIAPCFDKKLEAAREEAKTSRSVIDLVLSTEEIYKHILDTDAKYLDKSSTIKPDSIFSSINLIKNLLNPINNDLTALYSNSIIPPDNFTLYKTFTRLGSSNGYADYITTRLDTDFGVTFIDQATRKNKNFTELSIHTKPGKTYKVALVYGFKNIQNLVRQIKTKKCGYDYVEIMACPSGCINGGGQIKGEDPMARAKVVEEVYGLYDGKGVIGEVEGFGVQEVVRGFAERIDGEDGVFGVGRGFMKYKFEAVVNTNVQTISW